MEATETLQEHKKEVSKRAKQQVGTRKIVARGGILSASEA